MAILENILIEIYSHVKSCRYFPKMKNTPKSGKKSEQNAGGELVQAMERIWFFYDKGSIL